MSVARRLLRIGVVVMLLTVGVAAAALAASQTAWFRDWLRGYIVRQAGEYLNGTLTIGRLGGNLFYGIELEDVAVSMDGSRVVAVKDLGLDYSVFTLVSKGFVVDRLRLNQPILYLRRDGDTWAIGRLLKKQEQEADRKGPAQPMSVGRIAVTDGSVVIDRPDAGEGAAGATAASGVVLPTRVDRLDATLSFTYIPVRYTVDIAKVSFRASDPRLDLNALSGTVTVKDDAVFLDHLTARTAETSLSIDGAIDQYLATPVLKLHASSDKTSIPEIARLVPALAGIALQPACELSLTGPLDRLGVDVNVRSSAGQVTGNVVVDGLAPGLGAKGRVSVTHLNLAPLLNDPAQQSDVTANATLDLAAASLSDLDSARGTLSVTAPRLVVSAGSPSAAAGHRPPAAPPLVAERVSLAATIAGRRLTVNAGASAYGVTATSAGTVVLPADASGGSVQFDLRGETRHIDLRRLPRTLLAPAADTDVTAAYHATGAYRLPDASAGGKARPGAVTALHADLRLAPSTVAGASIADGSTVRIAMPTSNPADLGYDVEATVARLDLQRVGTAFAVPALADARYKSDIAGHVTAHGRGTTPQTMAVEASGAISDSTIGLLGGSIPQLTFTASLQQDAAHVVAGGSFHGLDPAIASGKPALEGAVDGTIDVDATLAQVSAGITPDRVAGTVRAAIRPSTIGTLTIDTATLDADVRANVADIRTLHVAGHDVQADAQGTLALDDAGESHLTAHAETPDLAAIGALAGQPVSGIASADLTVTGNRRLLQIAGTVKGGDVKYGANGALALSSDVTARVPDLDAAGATGSATTHATFATLAGQDINDLTAKTDYADRQVTFEVTARQPRRSLAAGGSLVLLPDHQEVHLPRLSLTTQGMTWQSPAGTEATVRYAPDSVAVQNLALVNGDQRIAVSGAFGRPGDTLTLTAEHVDVGMVDAVLLRPPQLAGRLDATATLAGTKAAPEAEARFTIAQGGFRQFRYDSFGGTVALAGRTITVDSTLQQSPGTQLTAKGHVPLSLVDGTAAVSTDPIDLHIDSTAIDAGLVQGFTQAVTKVTGTLEAHVHLGGSAADPQPDGTIAITKAGFTLVPTGVAYTALDGRVALQPDRIHIDQIQVLDNRKKALTVTGDLALRERVVGEMAIAVKADDFKVVDNEMGNVRINSNVRLTGQLNAARVEGDFGIATGQLNMDQILALVGDQAYATAPMTPLPGADNAGADAGTPGTSGTPGTDTAAGVAGPATSKPAPVTSAGLLDAMRVDLHFTIPNDLVVKASDLRAAGSPISLGALNLTVGGDLYVNKVPYDQIRLYGPVTTVRGTYDFQGRRFTILRDGSIRFEGTDDLNPALDIRSERVIQAVTANVNVQGTLTHPKIALTSTPPLEEADILSLVVFNQPINQLGQGEQVSLAARAQAMATSAVASGLASSIGRALNIDVFEISTAPDSGATAELTVGQQIGSNLFVKVQQGVGDESQTNFILEYELSKWLRLRTNLLQGSNVQQQLFQRIQGSGVDLLFFFSY